MEKELVFIEGDYTPENVKDGCVKSLTIAVFLLTLLVGLVVPCF